MRKNAITAPTIIPAVVSQNANCIKQNSMVTVTCPSENKSMENWKRLVYLKTVSF